jgi:cell division control protein 24
LINLEDAFEVRTITSKRQSRAISTADGTNEDNLDSRRRTEETEDATISKGTNTSQLSTPLEGIEVSSFDFENDLETSRVYRRAQRDTMDFSFRSSVAHTNAWSQFSGLSLSKISMISAIALPLYPDEIENGQHYALGREQAMPATETTAHAPRLKPLYQNCLELEQQLSQIPGFPEIFTKQRAKNKEEDPLTSLMQVFRRGVPFLMLLERVQGISKPTYITMLEDRFDPQKMPKVATYKFVERCISDLHFPLNECSLIGDLFGSDSTGYIKVRGFMAFYIGWTGSYETTQVIKVITRLIDMLTSSGDIMPVDLATILPEENRRITDPSSKDIIVEGFLVDERSYLAHLERFLELKREIDAHDSLRNDELNRILMSLNPIVDEQRRLLLGMEMTARAPSDVRFWRWAKYFEAWESISSTYAYFVTSEKAAKKYIRAVLARRQIFEDNYLNSVLRECLRLLPLPYQRLQKYWEFLQVRLLLHYSCSKHYSYNLYLSQRLC